MVTGAGETKQTVQVTGRRGGMAPLSMCVVCEGAVGSDLCHAESAPVW